MKDDILNLTLGELTAALVQQGLPRYTAAQIFSWLYKKDVADFAAMSDLARGARQALSEHFTVTLPVLAKHQVSSDGSAKFLFALADGVTIETAFIPDKSRQTICLSSQAGCKFACKFCLSGQGGFKRNLTTAEIVGQLLAVQREVKTKITNVVFMGVGEPLDNFDAVVKAIRIFTDTRALNLGRRKVCISTCGLAPQIRALADLDLGVKLSISLHASTDALRDTMMSVNKIYPLQELLEAARYFARDERHPVMFEYILIDGVNSSSEEARALAVLLKGFHTKVNLIPCNDCHLGCASAPTPAAGAFLAEVKKQGVFCTMRKSRGADIAAACGQLRVQ